MTTADFRTLCLQIATAEIGVREIPGDADNPRISEYKATTPVVAHTHDEVPWCSSFVNWVVEKAGRHGTRNPMARSWLAWGTPIRSPSPGCVAVLRRGAPPSGHVGFFVRPAPGDCIKLLGGNQGDQVKVSVFPESEVLGYRQAEVL